MVTSGDPIAWGRTIPYGATTTSAFPAQKAAMTQLIVDIGKSGTRMRLGTGAQVSGPGIPPELPGRDGGVEEITDRVRQVFAQFDNQPRPDVVVVGSTAVPPDELGLGRALQSIWPDALVGLCEDGVLAHAAALGGVGVVASIGTGVIVMGLDAESTLHRVDGWGPDLGDRGSAFELGRLGLAAAFEARDQVGPATQLGEAAHELLGGIDLQAAVRLLADPRRVEAIAGFAEAVCVAAEDGDGVAAGLVTASAVRVAQSCAAAAARCQQRTVAVRGGLSQAPAYLRALEIALARFELSTVTARHDVTETPAEVLFSDPYQRLLSYQTPSVSAAEPARAG